MEVKNIIHYGLIAGVMFLTGCATDLNEQSTASSGPARLKSSNKSKLVT